MIHPSLWLVRGPRLTVTRFSPLDCLWSVERD
jgi:hypothetical protein